MSATRAQRDALEALLAAYALEGDAPGAFARAWEAAFGVPGAAVALWEARPASWVGGREPNAELCAEDTQAFFACRSAALDIWRIEVGRDLDALIRRLGRVVVLSASWPEPRPLGVAAGPSVLEEAAARLHEIRHPTSRTNTQQIEAAISAGRDAAKNLRLLAAALGVTL